MAEGLAQHLQAFHQKLSTFFVEVEAEHFSWLRGMEEAAREMFLSPELEPKADRDKTSSPVGCDEPHTPEELLTLLSMVREKKVVEEKMKKKLAKTGGVQTRKQKALQMEEDEQKQQELLRKRREDEQHNKGRKIAELKKLAEQQQVEQAKERSHKPQKKGKALHLQMELAVVTEEEQNQKKKSPVTDSYQGPPLGSKEPGFPKVNPNDYWLDLKNDDSTDDESEPIPDWATGAQLYQAVTYQYYNPPNIDTLFGGYVPPNLEDIFQKNKPRYFQRTSSGDWHSPPLPDTTSTAELPYNLKKY